MHRYCKVAHLYDDGATILQNCQYSLSNTFCQMLQGNNAILQVLEGTDNPLTDIFCFQKVLTLHEIFLRVTNTLWLTKTNLLEGTNTPNTLWQILQRVANKLWNICVRYHCGGWPEEVNTCFLNSYMVYL